MWQHWINFLAGIWVIISAYSMSGHALTANLVVTGIIVVILALWGAMAGSPNRARQS